MTVWKRAYVIYLEHLGFLIENYMYATIDYYLVVKCAIPQYETEFTLNKK